MTTTPSFLKEEAMDELRAKGVPLLDALTKAGIRPLDPESVANYKNELFEFANRQPVLMVAFCILFALCFIFFFIAPGPTFLILAGFGTLLFASHFPGSSVFSTLVSPRDTLRWRRDSLQEYLRDTSAHNPDYGRTLPENIREQIHAIEEKFPAAQFYVEEIVRDHLFYEQKRLGFLLLIVEHDATGERYYVRRWRECVYVDPGTPS